MLHRYKIEDAPAPAAPDVCFSLPVSDWRPQIDAAQQAEAVAQLERGKIIVLPQLAFALSEEEARYLRPDCVKSGTKTVKFSLAGKRLWGVADKEKDSPVLKAMMERYALASGELIAALFPGYAPHMIFGNTSFRPVEAEGRVQSRRHDDRFLHVDAFPSRPTGGARHLRVFTNIHPGDRARVWKAGEPFADVSARFLPAIAPPLPGSARALRLLGITKALRTPYDHYMLHLHDAMKLDDEYQRTAPQTEVAFAPRSSWIVFTDQVSHAALSGQHALEQTFTLPVAALAHPEQSPQQVLKKLGVN